MKKLLVLFCLVFLTGCTKINENLESAISEKIHYTLEEKASSPYYRHKYYSYNIDPEVGRIESDKTSNVFSFNGTKFIMNLNIPSVLGSTDSTSTLSIDNNIVELHGTYTDHKEETHDFILNVYEVENEEVIILNTAYMDFYSVCSVNEIPNIASTMIDIARTIKVDVDLIKEEYASTETLKYIPSELELFQNIVPENGVIEELFDKEETNVDDDASDVDGVDGDYNATYAPVE